MARAQLESILERNYKAGSTKPLKNDNIPLVVSHPFCPFAERVLLVAKAKEIQCDVVNVDLISKPEWLFEINKIGKVPVLEIDTKRTLTESIIICEYFDEEYKESRKVQPNDAYEKCRQKEFHVSFDKMIAAFLNIYHTTLPMNDQMDTIENQLQVFEKELEFRSTRFIGGDDYPSLVDYFIWPWIERMPALIAIIKKERNWKKYFSSKYPLLLQYMLEMYKDDAVKAVALSDELHEEFFVYRIRLTCGEEYEF